MIRAILTVLVLSGLMVTWHPTSTSPYCYRVYEDDLAPMTFNIKGNPISPGEIPWEERASDVEGTIERSSSHVVGLQECWVPYLIDDLDGYSVVGSKYFNPGGNPILYNPERLVLLGHGSFPLAGNMSMLQLDNLGRKSYRQCVWAKFWDSGSQKAFYVFNVHYDHASHDERRESTRILARTIPGIAGEAPVILLGDFNAESPTRELIGLTESLGLTDVCTVMPETIREGTFHSFEGEAGEGDWIDHVLVSFELLPEGIETIECPEGEEPSDHWPVVVQLGWR